MFGDGCNQQVISDLQSCQGNVVMRRKASRDTSERWSDAQIAGLPSASTSAERSGVLIKNVVEEGQVHYFNIPEPTASSSHSVKSPVKGTREKYLPIKPSMEDEAMKFYHRTRIKSSRVFCDPWQMFALDCKTSILSHRQSWLKGSTNW